MQRLKDGRDVKRRSFVSKEMPSEQSDPIVGVSPKGCGRWGKCSCVILVTFNQFGLKKVL